MNRMELSLAVRAASQREWRPTRAEGLSRIEAFAPAMGQVYTAQRNHDRGPDARGNVSLLSPYIRRRLVTEREVVRAALAAHAFADCEKFVQEVFWRSYWKGWLESRPSVWADYRAGLARDRAAAAEDPELARRLAAAEGGETGVECFDAWVGEIAATGYLHNHARMWFASIWIFTLRLPWRLGADFFLRRLLDGDPASNTLSWRWIAGLHTRGKHYLARAENVAAFSGGRFAPATDAFDERAAPLVEEGAFPPPGPLPPAAAPDLEAPCALLITEEDCAPETLGLDLGRFRAAATLEMPAARSDRAVSDAVAAFDRGALVDAAARARAAGAPHIERLVAIDPLDLARWARRARATRIVTPWVPVGPVRDWLDAAAPALGSVGARVEMVRRPWDELVWPHATGGFFRLRERIPALLARLG